MNTDLIFEITQSVIALVVVFGTGYAVVTQNAHVVELIPFGTLILGYYFGKSFGKITAIANGNGNKESEK